MDIRSGQTHALSRPLCLKADILALKWIQLIQKLDGQLFESYKCGNLYGNVWMGMPCTGYVWIGTNNENGSGNSPSNNFAFEEEVDLDSSNL